MKVVYTAPNRAHHYQYALAMHKAGILCSFVSGFSRLSPRSGLKEIGTELYHADILQTLYIAGLKFGLPTNVSSYLAYLSKIEQDMACRKFIKNCEVFLFYNGSGLSTARYAKKRGVINIVEAVNSHVQYQEEILREEYHRLNLKWTPFYKKEKDRRIKEYEQADYILLPSEFVKNSFLTLGFPEQKLLKVPYGFNSFSPLTTRELIKSYDDEFTVLYVGSISIRKGLRYLIEAFNRLSHPRKKLILVGPQTDPDVFKGLSLSNDIVFTGALKGEELHNAYRKADVFCLPSVEDGFGLVLGESLSYGIPIIATTNTGALDIITDGQEGYIVPIRDSECIFEKLQLLADDTELLQTMKAAATSKSKNLQGWEESGNLLVATLMGVAAGKI